MRFKLRAYFVLLISTSLLNMTFAQEAKRPNRAEIAKEGKSATALIVGKTATEIHSGTAFCVHPDGLFITNEHVVRTSQLQLVLDPTGTNEKVYPAKVLKSSKELDLALVKIEIADTKLTPLALGDDDTLTELCQVFAFGFPFGAGLSTDSKTFPAITVTSVTVSSLRKKEKELHRIQLDGALNPGHSGGPVIDENGKVIGIVVTGIKGSGIAQAIPVSHIKRFVKSPIISLHLPSLTLENQSELAEFRANVSNILESGKGYDVSMILDDGVNKRIIPMKPEKTSEYIAKVKPVEKVPLLSIQAEFGKTKLSTQVQAADQKIKIADKFIDLKDIDRVEYSAGQSKLTLKSGCTVSGLITGLEAVEIDFGGKNMTVDLSKALSLSVSLPTTSSPVRCKIIVKRNDVQVGKLEQVLEIAGAKNRNPFVDVAQTALSPKLENNPISEKPFNVDPAIEKAKEKIYLSDMQEFGLGVAPPLWGFGKNGNLGSPLLNGVEKKVVVKEKVYEKGLGTHPETGFIQKASYVLGGKGIKFSGAVALEDTGNSELGKFAVLGDGKLLWISKEKTGQGQIENFEIDVREVEVLEIRAWAEGSNFGFHSVWLDPVVTLKP